LISTGDATGTTRTTGAPNEFSGRFAAHTVETPAPIAAHTAITNTNRDCPR
jgi:hypothetical protein